MILFGAIVSLAFVAAAEAPDIAPGVYAPVEGGWRIRISSAAPAAKSEATVAGQEIGVVSDDARLHRRPLYPSADKTMIWSAEDRAKIERCGFRPLVLAYNEPRFLFDFHSAGGLLGHLQLGLVTPAGAKWFHQWEELDVAYVDGRMTYALRDSAFPSVKVHLEAAPLADAAGVVLAVTVEGHEAGAQLVWAYGGASAYFTNYGMNTPEFTYAPGQCARNRLAWNGGQFSLRRAFAEPDAYIRQPFAAVHTLPQWEALMLGGSSWKARNGFGTPEGFAGSPKELVDSATWVEGDGERAECVVLQEIALPAGEAHGYVVVGMGVAVPGDIQAPEQAWAAALARNRGIAERIVTHTPDPYLDAAVRMMAFATEGMWGDTAILHGAWSWRFAYLGWRGWYGPTCYGWQDRIARSIRNHTSLGLVKEGADAGALGSILESSPGVFYNMNEVFFDQTRHYFEYTNDLELMQAIFPILEGIVAWESRRLQPGGADLYENSLNTWISDSHWYIGGQCAQASAYMLRAYTFLSELAKRLGRDPAPYAQKAQRIRAAMQQVLWMADPGVFAEYRDTRGAGLLHREPELPTIYHTAEFGAADPGQIALMLRWADGHLRTEVAPGGGRLVWSSNWFPNAGRTYTHSTYEMAYGENLNYALTNYLGGRADEAYAIIRATLCGIFNGPTPGGLSCHCTIDGKQRANEEFSDAISMWGRAVAEGLFGIAVKRPDNLVECTPQFPRAWHEASIRTPYFSYEWRAGDGQLAIQWNSPIVTAVRFRLPVTAEKVESLAIDGEATNDMRLAELGGRLCVEVTTKPGQGGRIELRYAPKLAPPPVAPVAPTAPLPNATVWAPPAVADRDLGAWQLVELSSVYNAKLTEVLPAVLEKASAPEPPASAVGFGYWRDHLLQYHGSRNQPLCDAAWRAKVGEDGVGWCTDRIPFRSSREGANIAVCTRAGGFPAETEFAVGGAGKTLYLMISGMTFPVQSHVANLRVSLVYEDGQVESKELVNPFDIGDCWSTWCGRYHDTAANGFENLGGRVGPAGSKEVADRTQPVAVDTEAQLVAFTLRPGAVLARVRVEAVANDAIFGVMGASVLR